MPICGECGKESPEIDIRYNPKWDNLICRTCFRQELIGNASDNKALGSLLQKNMMAAIKAADVAFKLLPKKKGG